MLPVLDGVVMELQDCALPLLRGEPVCLSAEGLACLVSLLRDEPVFCLCCLSER